MIDVRVRTVREANLCGYQLAYLALFGHQLDTRGVCDLADRAIRRADAHFDRFQTRYASLGDPQPALRGWGTSELRALVRRGRGLVIAGFHYGAYRCVPWDLAALGLPVTIAMDHRSWARHADRSARPSRLREPEYVDVEAYGSSVLLAHALRRGRVVYGAIDGGLGAESAARPAEPEVSFMGLRIRVRAGLLAIAQQCGAPVAVVVTRGPDESAEIAPGPILSADAGSRLHAWEPLARAAQIAFDFLASHVKNEPTDWAHARLLHTFRVPGSWDARSRTATASSPNEIGPLLAAGAHLRVDATRVIRIASSRGTTVVDVGTMRAWEVSRLEAALERPVSEVLASGLDARAVRALAPGPRQALLRFVGHLASSGVVVAQPEHVREAVAATSPLAATAAERAPDRVP